MMFRSNYYRPWCKGFCPNLLKDKVEFNQSCKIFLKKHHCTAQNNPSPPWRILFFGSDNFSVPILKRLISKFRTGTLISQLCVTTTSATSKKLHNPVYTLSKEECIEIKAWPIEAGEITNLYDVGVLASFGHMIPEDIIHSFPLGILNVHPSLLPKWRGAAPHIYPIIHGESETGVTIMKIHPHKFDIGEIVRQYAVTISQDETAEQLAERLADIGAQLLIDCIRDLPRSVEMAVPQPKKGVTRARKIQPSMAMIDWSNKTAVEIYNLHRGISHLHPLTTTWKELTVKLYNIKIDETTKNDGNIIPGLCIYDRKLQLIRIQCKDGKYITCSNVQIPGKKMTAKDFQNGYISKVRDPLNKKFS